jgi:aspartate aminotransferase
MIGTLSTDIERYLSIQERFEALRQGAMLKVGRNLCDLSYANPYDGPPVQAIQAIRESLDSERTLSLQYTPYGGATITRRLVAQHLSKSHQAGFIWRNIVMTPGAMSALNILFRAIRTERAVDEVILITPCWLDYPLYLANLRMRPVFVPSRPNSFRLDLDRIHAAVGPATRAIILCQPANPTGIIYSRGELQQLGEILKRADHEILLISDECHRDVLFDDEAFVSPLEYFDSTCIVYSFGKSLFMQGQRIGYIAVSPNMEGKRGFTTLLERLCRTMGFCTPTSLMQAAVCKLLAFKPNMSRIAARRARAISELTRFGYRVVPSQATFFLYPGSLEEDEFSFATRLAKQGVLVLPSTVFHDRGHFRISLTASDEMLDRALSIFCKVSHEIGSRQPTVATLADERLNLTPVGKGQP